LLGHPCWSSASTSCSWSIWRPSHTLTTVAGSLASHHVARGAQRCAECIDAAAERWERQICFCAAGGKDKSGGKDKYASVRCDSGPLKHITVASMRCKKTVCFTKTCTRPLMVIRLSSFFSDKAWTWRRKSFRALPPASTARGRSRQPLNPRQVRKNLRGIHGGVLG